MAQKIPKHIVRLTMLLGFFLLIAFAAKIYLTDPSYYRFGYYRADAVPQLAAGEPVYQGSQWCLDCHEERKPDWPASAHKTVQCEVCHGPAPEHPDDKVSLIQEDSIKLCTTCHEYMPARPAGQPQIVPGEHPFADGEVMPCIECHNPHAPGPVVRADEAETVASPDSPTAVRINAAPPGASKCAKCHGKQGEGVKKTPPLAGLESAHFIEQMIMYRTGGASKIMTRFAKSLSDEEIAELATYYESLPGGETP